MDLKEKLNKLSIEELDELLRVLNRMKELEKQGKKAKFQWVGNKLVEIPND
jgi:hypothetical protein